MDLADLMKIVMANVSSGQNCIAVCAVAGTRSDSYHSRTD